MEAYLLIAFAVIADLINWIPVLNWIVTLVTLPAYQIYFYMKGMRGIYTMTGNLIELIPALSALPGITTGVVVAVIADRVTASKLGRTALGAAAIADPTTASRIRKGV